MTRALFCITLLAFSAACSKKPATPALAGKTLNLYLKDNVKTSDPVQVYDTVSVEPMSQIYETLYEYDLYSAKTRLVPSLAAAMPTYSKDRLTVTIPLKKGVRFQDDACFEGGKGRELKAKDFLYNWKRLAVTRNTPEGFWVFDNKVVGFNDFQARHKDAKAEEEIMDAEVEGMKALDDHTIQIKLTKPYPQLLYVLAMNFTSPVPMEAVKKYGPDFINHPVGTGPYRAVVWEPQNKMVLVRNENFREEHFPPASRIDEEFKSARAYAGKQLPLVDNLVFTVIKESQPRWLQFLAGNLDQIEVPKDNDADAFDAADPTQVKAELKAKGYGVSIQTGTVWWYLNFNMRDQLLGQNKLLRQALSSAIDRKEWLKIMRSNRGVLANELNPVGLTDRCGSTKLRHDFNVERAKALLAKAGYPEGKGLPTIKFDLRGADSLNRQIGEFVSKSMAAIGVKIEVSLNTFPAFLDKRNKGNLQFFLGGWNMDYPDIENNFQLFYGPYQAPGPNDGAFKHAKYDELFQKMALMESGPARRAIACQMDEILQDEAALVMGFYENLYRMTSPRIRNYRTLEMAWGKYKYMDVVDAKTTTAQAQ